MEKNIKKTISLYSKSGWKRFFARIRFWDAPLDVLETYIPQKGVVTELGCGDGILSNFIAISSSLRTVLGIDIDKKRVKAADKGLKNARFMIGDIRKVKIPPSDAIVISHVLHHLPTYQDQEAILKSSIEKLKSQGVLIILEIYKTNHPKYVLGWFFDHFLVPIFFEGRIYSPILYRSKREWISLLHSLHMQTKTIELVDGKPIANILMVSHRKSKEH